MPPNPFKTSLKRLYGYGGVSLLRSIVVGKKFLLATLTAVGYRIAVRHLQDPAGSPTLVL
jgi:hypothetical protein